MVGLGVRIETVEKILNHTSGSFRGIVAVYQKYDFASEKRAAARPLGRPCGGALRLPLQRPRDAIELRSVLFRDFWQREAAPIGQIGT